MAFDQERGKHLAAFAQTEFAEVVRLIRPFINRRHDLQFREAGSRARCVA